jgi:hypothetical protein
MPTVRTAICAIVIVSLVGGCSYIPTRSLQYEPVSVSIPAAARRVLGVRVFREERPPRAYPGMFANLFLTYVPFIPYVRVEYERLDESDKVHKLASGGFWNENDAFTHLLMQAVTADLSASGFFSEVRVIGDGLPPSDIDYVLEGTLQSTEFNLYTTSYMLGVAGVLLWFLPIPNQKQIGFVEIDLSLHDRSGAEVWADRLTGSGSRIYTMWNSGGGAISSRYSLEIKRYGKNREGIDGNSLWAYYASALRTGMGGVKESLALFLAEHDRTR